MKSKDDPIDLKDMVSEFLSENRTKVLSVGEKEKESSTPLPKSAEAAERWRALSVRTANKIITDRESKVNELIEQGKGEGE